MAVALVVAFRNLRQAAQLDRTQQSIRNRDAQHRSQALEVQSVLQPQRQKLAFGQLPIQIALGLSAKLADAVFDQLLVGAVVAVHANHQVLKREAGRWRMGSSAAAYVTSKFLCRK